MTTETVSPPVPDELYVNPQIWELLGMVSKSEDFPDEEGVAQYYIAFTSMSPGAIVGFIMNNVTFLAYIDLVQAAIDGMEPKAVGRVLTTFIDKNYPNVMQRINTNEDEFQLYRSVIYKLVEEIKNYGSSTAGI
jgi:hypothetical protein